MLKFQTIESFWGPGLFHVVSARPLLEQHREYLSLKYMFSKLLPYHRNKMKEQGFTFNMSREPKICVDDLNRVVGMLGRTRGGGANLVWRRLLEMWI